MANSGRNSFLKTFAAFPFSDEVRRAMADRSVTIQIEKTSRFMRLELDSGEGVSASMQGRYR